MPRSATSARICAIPARSRLSSRRRWALTGDSTSSSCNHAQSGDDGSILDMTAERLDGFWATNTRSTLLLTQAFAASASRTAPIGARPGERAVRSEPVRRTAGRVFWMTSGQIHGPMRGEVAYATSKAALAGVTKTVAAELLDRGIILNTIDPGPVNTGYLDPETTDRPLDEIEELVRRTPFGRFGRPSDPASLIGVARAPTRARGSSGRCSLRRRLAIADRRRRASAEIARLRLAADRAAVRSRPAGGLQPHDLGDAHDRGARLLRGGEVDLAADAPVVVAVGVVDRLLDPPETGCRGIRLVDRRRVAATAPVRP